MTKEDIKYTIELLPECSDDMLSHKYKCCSSQKTTTGKKLVEPLMRAIEKERKKRGLTLTIGSAVKPKAATITKGAASDMYED